MAMSSKTRYKKISKLYCLFQSTRIRLEAALLQRRPTPILRVSATLRDSGGAPSPAPRALSRLPRSMPTAGPHGLIP